MLPKLIKNDWQREPDQPCFRAPVLQSDKHPEGLDVDRLRFFEAGSLSLSSDAGHIVSITAGGGKLQVAGENRAAFDLRPGVHVYIPPGLEPRIEAEPDTMLIRTSSASAEQTRGRELILRDEQFLAACTTGSHALRWILTPQYLSRRIFLHHDMTLVSKSGHPVSWFHTTMFDVSGLPRNDEGESVFKMSYNSRTEFNVCHRVSGSARVRMAEHPYSANDQSWGPWLGLDDECTYHLNEAAGGPEEECLIDEATQSTQYFRNKHEVYIADGAVSLFCLFDPAPTGVERHRPGEYSDYEPVSHVLGTPLYENHRREIGRFDEMLDRLSLAKAAGRLSDVENTVQWGLYLQGRQAQIDIEDQLLSTLIEEGQGRERILTPWMQSSS